MTKKKLNRDQKRARKAADASLFVKKYSRKAQKGQDPNDRTYDRELQKKIENMSPEDLSELLKDDEE